MLTHSEQSQWFNSKWSKICFYETLAGSSVVGAAVGACLPHHTTWCQLRWLAERLCRNALSEDAAFKRSALFIYPLHYPMNDVPGEQRTVRHLSVDDDSFRKRYRCVMYSHCFKLIHITHLFLSHANRTYHERILVEHLIRHDFHSASDLTCL